MVYVPLRIHTEHSLGGGMCRIEPLVERARTLRIETIGITDEDTTSGWIPLDRAARAAGIRPLFGVSVRLRPEVDGQEAWEDAGARIALLARDRNGMRNLNRLLSHLHLESGEDAPAATVQDLSRFAGGVLALDGGWQGPVSRALHNGVATAAVRVAARLREVFGADGFYMELQASASREESVLQAAAVQIARRLNVPLVATADVRHVEETEAEAYSVLRRIGNRQVSEAVRPHHLPSDAEMLHLHRELPEAITNTSIVAERCQVELERQRHWDATYRPDSGRRPVAELRHACERGACETFGAAHYEDLPVAVRDRIAHELAMIEEKELASCFLIVQDVVRYAKEEGISVGPGCGAAAGSLVCHVLGITDVDPLQHGLYFERFWRPDEAAMPEFTLQVEHERRSEMLQAIRRRLGPERVAFRCDVRPMSTPSLVREVGCALAVHPEELVPVARILAQRPDAGIWRALDESKALQKLYQEVPAVRHVLEVASRLEGLPHHPTLHAGGLLIAPDSMLETASVERAECGDPMVRSTPEAAAVGGILQLEILADRSLTLLHEARRVAGLRAEEVQPAGQWEAALVPLQGGDTAGIAALDTPAMRFLLRRVQPRSLEDLVAALALSREVSSGRVERFLGHRNGLAARGTIEAELAAILHETHGFLLYPEQVLQVCVEFAALSAREAEWLLQSMQKRAIGDMVRARARFLQGAVETGHELERAERVFDTLRLFRDFGSGKAHAVAEAQLALRLAALRVEHPIEFLCASLNGAIGRDRKIRRILAGARAGGVAVHGVDVNRSDALCTVTPSGVRLGLGFVRLLSRDEVEVLVHSRQSTPFTSLADVAARTRLSPRCLASLVASGACESIGAPRHGSSSRVATASSSSSSAVNLAVAVQMELELDPSHVGAEDVESRRAGVSVGPDPGPIPDPAGAWEDDPWVRCGYLWADARTLETTLLDILPDRSRVRIAGVLRRVAEVRTKAGDAMAFASVEDLFGTCDVVLFPSVYDSGQWLERAGVGQPFVFDGVLEERDGRKRVVVERVRAATEFSSRQMELFVPALAPVVSMHGSRSGFQRGGSQQPNAERRASHLGLTASGGRRPAGTRGRRGPHARSRPDDASPGSRKSV